MIAERILPLPTPLPSRPSTVWSPRLCAGRKRLKLLNTWALQRRLTEERGKEGGSGLGRTLRLFLPGTVLIGENGDSRDGMTENDIHKVRPDPTESVAPQAETEQTRLNVERHDKLTRLVVDPVLM